MGKVYSPFSDKNGTKTTPFGGSLRSRNLDVERQERMAAREGDTRGERERLPRRPTKIVSSAQSNYLHPRVSPSRALVLSCAHYFQAPVTQATPQ